MRATVGDIPWMAIAAFALIGTALATALLIFALGPLLRRYAVAKPGIRSSHQEPTPQGGGIAVIAAATAAICVCLLLLLPEITTWPQLTTLLAAVILLASIGALADTRPIAVAPRLLLQILAVAAVVYQLPSDLHIVPIIPPWLERVLLVFGGVWFVNLVNFMDGLDWITVAQVVPITAAIALIGLLGLLPPEAVVVSLVTCGAMVGFSFFNRPVAKLFLGDVGSLPIGLVIGWLLVLLAGNGGRVAAFLLPLYSVADSTITLLRRLIGGERVWEAHRSHFYQRATDGGFSVIDVVTRVFVTNLTLGGLAIFSIIYPGRVSQIGAVIAGTTLVTCLLAVFARGRR